MQTIQDIKKQFPVHRGVRGVSDQLAARRTALIAEGYADFGRTTLVRGLKLAILQHLISSDVIVLEYRRGGTNLPSAYYEHWLAQQREYEAAVAALPAGAEFAIDGDYYYVVTRIATKRMRGFRGTKVYRRWDWDGTAWLKHSFFFRRPKKIRAFATARNCRQMLRTALGRARAKRYSVETDRDGYTFITELSSGEKYHPSMSLLTPSCARDQVTNALTAFARRRAEKIDNDTLAKRAATTYVSLDDSIRAGNCESLSREFAREMWQSLGAGECAVRADVVLAVRNDDYTRRAVAAALDHGARNV